MSEILKNLLNKTQTQWKTLINWFSGNPNISEPRRKNEVKVKSGLMFGAGYDDYTKQAVLWMNKIALKLELPTNNFVVVLKDDLSKGDVRTAMAKTTPDDRIEIFCGHGDYHALLGTKTDIGDSRSDNHSSIYDINMISEKPQSMIAFCCKSAEKFGRHYGTKYVNKAFLGFDDEVLLLPLNEIFMQELENIFTKTVLEICYDGQINAYHRDFMINLYNEAILFFEVGGGKRDIDHFLCVGILADQLEQLRFFNTLVTKSRNNVEEL